MPVTIYGKEHKSDCKCCSCKSQRGEPSWNWKGGISLNRKEYNKKKYEEKERKIRLETYGLTFADYDCLWEQQGGVCSICGLSETKKSFGTRTRRLSVDHCHETGNVRGLLCNQCNVGLGNFNDDIDVMASAILYLINSKLKKVI